MRNLIALPLFLAATCAAQMETITLQQGFNGYSGCTTRAMVETRPATGIDDRVFPLRGSLNSLHVRFEIPARAAKLARARLMVYLPAARNPNRMTEIFCHEAITGGRQISIDEETDYDNGRRRGAVDSVELFAPAHQGWYNFPFLPLGVPPGGKWIEFNITPLAEKWLAGEARNNGVLLQPADSPQRESASTWEIDVPAAAFVDAALRPKLVLEYADAAQPGAVSLLAGMTDSLQRISDRSTRYGYRGRYGASYRMSMAGNEFEGFQIVLYPMMKDLEAVELRFSDLESPGGTIPAADIQWFREDSYQLRRNYLTRELFAGKLYRAVDPLLPAEPVRLRRQVHTPFYVQVRTRPGTSAGTYRGRIDVLSGDRLLERLNLEVKVWPFDLPEKWNFHSMGQFIQDAVRRFHGELTPDLLRRYEEFLLDHRFPPTEQYRPSLSPRNLDYALGRGANTIYLSGNFNGAERELAPLRKDYAAIRDRKLLDQALVYIGDETDNWDEMRRRADWIHAHLPGAQVMIGGSYPRPELIGFIDIYDPQIGGSSPVYSFHENQAHLIAEAQKRGEEFYWYVAAGPQYPYPNVQVENPLIASRVLFWMTWKYGVTGFEYYCYNIWERNGAKDPAKRYPAVGWKADGWSKGWPSNGDGMLFYPGPVSSLRFETMRDGIEDWEMLRVLADALEALGGRPDADRYRELAKRSEALLRVHPEVVSSFTAYTQDPARLLDEREKAGNLLAEILQVVTRPELAHAAQKRTADQAKLRRAMLRERHLAACKRLGVEPLSDPAWQALWP